MTQSVYSLEINSDRERRGEGILGSEMAFEFVPSAHVRLAGISLLCGKQGQEVTITVRVRRDRYGSPGEVIGEISRQVHSIDWHTFELTQPLRLPRKARYWIGVIARTGQETPPFAVDIQDGKPTLVYFDPTGSAMYSPPLSTNGVPVTYFTSRGGRRWDGPFSGGLIARLHFAEWTSTDLEAITQPIIGSNDLVQIVLGSDNVLTAKMDPESLDPLFDREDPAHCPLSVVSTVPIRTAVPGLDVGQCQCVYTLGAPFNNPNAIEVAHFGDSLLVLESVRGLGTVELTGPEGVQLSVQCRLVPNESGRLAKVVAVVPLQPNVEETEGVGYAAVSGLLSGLSMTHRVPLEIVQSEVFVIANLGELRYIRQVIKPHSSETLSLARLTAVEPLQEFDSFKRVITLYREGANEWNPMLRFLGWFKAIEALMALRAEVGKRHKGIRMEKSTLPDSQFLQFRFPELLGMPLSKIASSYLPGKDYRHAVAHWSIKDSDLLSHDQHGGVVLYHHLSILAEEVFHGLIRETVAAIEGLDTR